MEDLDDGNHDTSKRENSCKNAEYDGEVVGRVVWLNAVLPDGCVRGQRHRFNHN